MHRVAIKMAFFISPTGSFQRGMQTLKNCICVMDNIVHIHTVLEGFAYPCETRYADFVRVYGTAHLNTGGQKMTLSHSTFISMQQANRKMCSHARGTRTIDLYLRRNKQAVRKTCLNSIKKPPGESNFLKSTSLKEIPTRAAFFKSPSLNIILHYLRILASYLPRQRSR